MSTRLTCDVVIIEAGMAGAAGAFKEPGPELKLALLSLRLWRELRTRPRPPTAGRPSHDE